MCSLDPEPNYENIDPEAEFAIEREHERKIKEFDNRLVNEYKTDHWSSSDKLMLSRVIKWFRKEFQETIGKGPYDSLEEN